ncbi:ankyrin repeat domain-containing protein [Denitromonas iodatirespirans]|uniref:Ankyrin repeat domain-containing protein n=1 Tax=Denitromonas iodatirespirans TaxID=2795389 RepID=A0A944DCT2_DENI1|nr:ankyrin repeat domain-containing protein [Denitromonas iodatirespirans]MBT0962716.1 ankyrin repeat domain-containing protein [Denitromonas iodatirespirans]
MRHLMCIAAALTSLGAHAYDTPQEFAGFLAPPDEVRGRPLPPRQAFDAVRQTGNTWLPTTAEAASLALLRAARADDWPAVLAQLKAGANPNVVDAEWRGGVLARAAGAGQTEVVRKLLAAGADPDQRGEQGFTPLGAAALRGHAPVVRLLLRHEADPDRKSADGAPPLVNAARMGHAAVVEALLDAGADPTRADRLGHHTLSMAAARGDVMLVRRLLDLGMEVDARDGEGRTAFFWAGLYSRAAVREVLLAAGADAAATVRVK